MREITWLMVAFAATACSEGGLRYSAPQSLEGVAADVPLAVDRPARGPSTIQYRPHPSVFALEPPPPISGGTLLSSRDGTRLVLSDPARDQLFILALPSGSIIASHDFDAGVGPGRVTEDDRGNFHVALRNAGQVVSLSRDGDILMSRDVCAAPRGLVAHAGLLHVACAEGLLVTFVSSGGLAQRIIDLETDLRDVVVDEATGDLVVSLFRRAEALFLDEDGLVVARRTPPNHQNPVGDRFLPNVAWRMRAAPGGGVLLLHQRAQTTTVSLETDEAMYAGTECSVGVVQAVLSRLTRDGEPTVSPAIIGLSLAVDFDVWNDIAVVVAPGVIDTPRDGIVMRSRHQARYLSVAEATAPGGPGSCVTGRSLPREFEAQLTSVAVTPAGDWIFQGREPAIVVRDGDVVTTLPTDSVTDDGHAFFHQSPGVAIACASCHPEGGEDGHTWRFADVGPRRTPSLRGPILDSAPFNWNGDMSSFSNLVHSTVEDQMGGPQMHWMYVRGLGRFIETIDHLPRPVAEDPAAVARGATLFSSVEVGCTDCHTGPRLSDDRTVDVGTGRPFQTPGLRGVRYRAPYMHDGCAETLHDVFYECRADRHGDVDHLSSDEIDDIVAFLESV